MPSKSGDSVDNVCILCARARVSQQLGMTQFGVAACQRLLSYPDTQTYNNSL